MVISLITWIVRCEINVNFCVIILSVLCSNIIVRSDKPFFLTWKRRSWNSYRHCYYFKCFWCDSLNGKENTEIKTISTALRADYCATTTPAQISTLPMFYRSFFDRVVIDDQICYKRSYKININWFLYHYTRLCDGYHLKIRDWVIQ